MKTLFAAAVAALIWIAPANAALFHFEASLDGLQENPPVITPGSGFGTAVYDNVAQTLAVELSFENLTQPTTDGHIHCCAPPGMNAGVRLPFIPAGFPVGVTSGTFSHVFNLNTDLVGITLAAFVAGLLGEQAYMNVHTEFVRSGEIRGQLELVPLPSAVILFGTALGGLALLGLRRRRPRRPPLA
jgi:hypothetical protein